MASLRSELDQHKAEEKCRLVSMCCTGPMCCCCRVAIDRRVLHMEREVQIREGLTAALQVLCLTHAHDSKHLSHICVGDNSFSIDS